MVLYCSRLWVRPLRSARAAVLPRRSEAEPESCLELYGETRAAALFSSVSAAAPASANAGRNALLSARSPCTAFQSTVTTTTCGGTISAHSRSEYAQATTRPTLPASRVPPCSIILGNRSDYRELSACQVEIAHAVAKGGESRLVNTISDDHIGWCSWGEGRTVELAGK